MWRTVGFAAAARFQLRYYARGPVLVACATVLSHSGQTTNSERTNFAHHLRSLCRTLYRLFYFLESVFCGVYRNMYIYKRSRARGTVASSIFSPFFVHHAYALDASPIASPIARSTDIAHTHAIATILSSYARMIHSCFVLACLPEDSSYWTNGRSRFLPFGRTWVIPLLSLSRFFKIKSHVVFLEKKRKTKERKRIREKGRAGRTTRVGQSHSLTWPRLTVFEI